MATIVIHGTMTIAPAKSARWWWDSWNEGGFLHAVREGMQSIAGSDDVWTIGGRSVREIAELQMKWSLWSGYQGQHPTHQGHFKWSGTDDYLNREAGAGFLAKYLNCLAELAPRERLAIIAHSHGCNVVKMASAMPGLSPNVHIDRAVFLACPHFVCDGRGAGCPEGYYPYRLDPARFGGILNLSSETDSIQVGMADAVPGPAGMRWTDYLPPTAHRTDPDPEAAALYENWSIPTEDSGRVAHTVMHGATIGSLVGVYLAEHVSFGEILDQGGNRLLPVPLGDVGG